MASSPTVRDVHQLLQLLEVTTQAVRTVINEWSKIPSAGDKVDDQDKRKAETQILTRELFEAKRTLISATGKFVELVATPSERVLEVSSQYNESRCLHIAVGLRVADILAKAGDIGVPVDQLSDAVGIEAQKLSRVMRCLCSIHIFKEVREDCFANNGISASLIHNEALRAYVMMFSFDLYSASDALPRALLDPELGPSYSVKETAFQKAANTTAERWNWLEEEVTVAELQSGSGSAYPGPFGPELTQAVDSKSPETLVKRPEHAVFGLAMVGGGRVFGVAHLFGMRSCKSLQRSMPPLTLLLFSDYPWKSLGEALVVDVGGGVGGFCLELSHLYPDLKFIVQDRPPALEQAKTEIWPQQNPRAVEEGRVTFMPHDFFDENPVKGADVYWLRYILHDWSDEYCIQILSGIRKSMGFNSRLLICDQVMNTTLGFEGISSAPEPLPANYGYFARYSHQRDITMMSIINGIERTPAQFERIINLAGLSLSKIYDCRSQVSVVMCELPKAGK
ncbi:unnamed protein product [Penicillium egyptiacum]|uniref:O-methyltransferase domain-containing protein n=1 Tax=Penicillium egyptiacum TaxID=1303716 RepID=A0A9W4K683_9EURO|nr:unnamed protein product [Penicillium egyptiacum]